MQEKEYNKNPEDENSKKNLECISLLRKSYMLNLGYILKILNKIYRGLKLMKLVIKDLWIFWGKKKIIERIRNSGAYSFINDLYGECFIANPDKLKNIPKKKDDLTKNFTTQADFTNLNQFNQEQEKNNNIENNNNDNQNNEVKSQSIKMLMSLKIKI